jgi:hypothetical protein
MSKSIVLVIILSLHFKRERQIKKTFIINVRLFDINRHHNIYVKI